MPGSNGGTQSITNQTDVAIGVSGKSVRVKCAHLLSGGTASTVTLRNGTSASGTAYVQLDGTISKGITTFFGPDGIYFPGGCFADVDANTVALTIAYEQNQ